MDSEQILNVVGALALSLISEMEFATEQAADLSGSATAAVMVIAQQPGLSIDELRQILKLSHSGCVRLIDRLVVSGFVLREGGPDGRTTSLKATQSGLDQAARISISRLNQLQARLALLSANELDQFRRIASKLLAQTTLTAIAAQRVCRLCDHSICFHRGHCPVADGLKSTL